MSAAVACVGIAVTDFIYGLDRLPSEDGKFLARSRIESGGGMAANAAVIVARLGGRATWCGRVGDDEIGRGILDGLQREGVDTSLARIIPGMPSPHSIVLVDRDGNRAIIVYRASLPEPEPSWLPLDRIVQADAVLADNRWPAEATAVLAAARRRDLPAVLDADVASDGGATIAAVRAASHVIFSEPALAALYGGDPAEGLGRAARDCPFVAVTRGAEGVLWRDAGGALRALPAFPVAAVETLGAGDIFHGAFALALAEGGDEAAALRFAAATAALKCTGTGGRASYPDRHAVEALLRAGPDHLEPVP